MLVVRVKQDSPRVVMLSMVVGLGLAPYALDHWQGKVRLSGHNLADAISALGSRTCVDRLQFMISVYVIRLFVFSVVSPLWLLNSGTLSGVWRVLGRTNPSMSS